MADSWGDGWNTAVWTWTNSDTATQVSTGTLTSGSSGTASLCVDITGDCYSLVVGADSYPSEVSWVLETASGDTWESGGDASTVNICIPTPSPTFPPSPVPSLLPTTPAPSTASKPPTQLPTSSVPSLAPTSSAPTASFPPTLLPTSTVESCWTLLMKDSYGDGWNSAIWTWINTENDGVVSRASRVWSMAPLNTRLSPPPPPPLLPVNPPSLSPNL